MIVLEESPGRGRVATFFYINDTIEDDSTEAIVADDYGEYKTQTTAHIDLYDELVRYNRDLANYDYDYFPRGRIVYNTDEDEFIVYIDECLNKPDIKSEIISYFKLPRSNTKFDFDEHYKCHECNKDYVNITENDY